ncbi:MAG: hotdog fold thioesterase [Actinomycetota bacterium]
MLGFELLGKGPGTARLRATVRPEHCNFLGSAHGGFVFALADTALAVASNSHGPRALAVAASIHFATAAPAGDVLIAQARELSLGTRTASYEVTVTAGSDVVAVFTGTVFRRAERPANSVPEP